MEHRELRVYNCADGHVTVVPTTNDALIPATRTCERCDRPVLPRQAPGYDVVSRPGR